MLIDYAFCVKHGACYSGRYLRKLFPGPVLLREVLTRKDGPWQQVTDLDRLWVATRPGALTRQERRLAVPKLVRFQRAVLEINNVH